MSGINVSVEYDAEVTVSCTTPIVITIRNEEHIPLAAKVVTPHADWYYVTPPRMYLSPKATTTVTVQLCPPVEFAKSGSTVSTPNPRLPSHRDDQPLGDLVRVEVRALVSIPGSTVNALSLADFNDHWRRGVPQDPHTVGLKLRWFSSEEYLESLTAAERGKHASLRRELEQEMEKAVAAQNRVEALRSRMAGYEDDMDRGLRRLEEKRSVVGLHWTVAVLAIITAFAAGAGPDSTIALSRQSLGL